MLEQVFEECGIEVDCGEFSEFFSTVPLSWNVILMLNQMGVWVVETKTWKESSLSLAVATVLVKVLMRRKTTGLSHPGRY